MSSLYTSGVINIPSVTGDIVITATATAATVSSISAVFNQGNNVIYDTDSLDDLKQYLTVTATYEGGASAVVTGYTLSGTLTEGTSVVTVSYGGKTATFNVTVSVWSTAPQIAQYNANYRADMTIGSATGLCITEPYWYTLDMDALKATTYYDSENDYFNMTGVPIKLKICFPNTSGASGFQAHNKIVYSNETDGGTLFSFSSVTFSESEGTIACGRYVTGFTNLPNNKVGIAFTLVTGDINNSYAYWSRLNNNVPLPIGVNDGDIIFAGSNTQYYGMHNISEATS